MKAKNAKQANKQAALPQANKPQANKPQANKQPANKQPAQPLYAREHRTRRATPSTEAADMQEAETLLSMMDQGMHAQHKLRAIAHAPAQKAKRLKKATPRASTTLAAKASSTMRPKRSRAPLHPKEIGAEPPQRMALELEAGL